MRVFKFLQCLPAPVLAVLATVGLMNQQAVALTQSSKVLFCEAKNHTSLEHLANQKTNLRYDAKFLVNLEDETLAVETKIRNAANGKVFELPSTLFQCKVDFDRDPFEPGMRQKFSVECASERNRSNKISYLVNPLNGGTIKNIGVVLNEAASLGNLIHDNQLDCQTLDLAQASAQYQAKF